MRTTLMTLALSLAATGLAAQPQQTMPLTYGTFEEAVSHIDLADCPESLAAEDVFCRATLASDMIHVFVFSLEGDSPLVGFASYDPESLAGLLN